MTQSQIAARQAAQIQAAIPRIIRDLCAEYAAQGLTLWDIGNGHCENFADTTFDRLIGTDWRSLELDAGGAWANLSTECLYAAPDDGTLHCDAWDWDLLSQHYGIDIAQDARSQLDAIVPFNPSHVWIYAGGRHYDCEHPTGVDNFFDLSFFVRYLEMLSEPFAGMRGYAAA
jgi:hypothetical protein